MSDDLLERATRALREESVPSAIDLAETRARLLSASTTKRARRTAALRWVLPLAAAFVAGSAFAATQGGVERAVQAVRAVQSWLADAPVTEPPKKKAKKRTSPALFYRQVVAELRKVVWPSRRDLATFTAVVLVFVVIMVAIVFGLDALFTQGVVAVFGGS